jgi:hypothetical protein
MKESEGIKIEMLNDKDDNDQRDIGYLRAYKRAIKKERFEEIYWPKLNKLYECERIDNTLFIVYSPIIGVIKIYPKANSVYLRATNEWIKGRAIGWVKTNLLK